MLAALLMLIATALAAGEGLRVAVAPFETAVDTTDSAHLGHGLQAMLTTDLVQVEGLTVVERARLQDLLDELSLGADGVLDPSTAAELGQLLGATHLVTGTVTLDGGTLRLDAQLLEVETGEVVLAAESTGERDAFFELEKELVKGLLVALEQAPSPQERARIARIHTADFTAFSDFGEGLALYDAERFEEAQEILERATQRDEDFRLARRTLEEIEALRAELRQKVTAVRVEAAEVAFVVRQASARVQAAQVGRLQAIAADPEAPEEDRWTALLLLSDGLGVSYHPGRFGALERSADTFALRRAGERAWQQLWSEVEPRLPEVSPRLRYDWGSWFARPSEADLADGSDAIDAFLEEDFSTSFAWLRGSAFDEERRLRTLRDCSNLTRLGEREWAALWLDQRGRAEVLTQLLRNHPDCFGGAGSAKWVSGMLSAAEAWRGLGVLSRSGALLQEALAVTSDERLLKSIDRALAHEANATAVLDDARLDATGRELLRMAPSFSTPDAAWRTSGMRAWANGPEQARWMLNKTGRSWPQRGLLWVGEVPVWKLAPVEQLELATGPRPDPYRSDSIRYYGDDAPLRDVFYSMSAGRSRVAERPAAPVEPAVFVLGGSPHGDLALELELNHQPAQDWSPRQRERPGEGVPEHPVASGRPAVSLLFGLQDLSTPDLCDPASPSSCEPVPMRGLAVVLDGAELRLVEVVERAGEGGGVGAVAGLDEVRVLGREQVRSEPSSSMVLTVEGSEVSVRVGKQRARWTLEEPVRGFVGLSLHGLGYVQVSGLSLE